MELHNKKRQPNSYFLDNPLPLNKLTIDNKPIILVKGNCINCIAGNIVLPHICARCDIDTMFIFKENNNEI